MRPAFHPDASFFGYAGEQLAIGTPFLFDWIDKNGPAPKIEPRVVSVDILGSIAVVRLEVAGWSGKMAGSGRPHVRSVHASQNAKWLDHYPESVSLARMRPQLMARPLV